MWKIVIFYSVFFPCGFVSASDYCKISEQHLLCGTRPYEQACGDTSKIIEPKLTQQDKDEIVHVHNEFRNNVAQGGDQAAQGEKFPSATNIMELKWDDELASLAAGHVRRCKVVHSCDVCSTVDRWQAGECITLQNTKDLSWRSGIEMFYDGERKHFLVEDITKGVPLETNAIGYQRHEYGHFAQVIWHDVEYVGCSKLIFYYGVWNTIMTCNYGPTCCWPKKPVYEIGPPCSNCPNNRTCSKRYTALCSSNSRHLYPSLFIIIFGIAATKF